MEEFLALNPEVRRGILDCIVRVADRLRQQIELQIERVAADLVWQLREEEGQEAGSSASPDTASDKKWHKIVPAIWAGNFNHRRGNL